MLPKNRQEKVELGMVLLVMVVMIALILCVGLFGMICQKTIVTTPVMKESSSPVLDKAKDDIEKAIREREPSEKQETRI